jgi:hypothetical protein
MDDFIKQLYPEGEERWIKVKYTDANKAIKSIRFNENGYSNENLGFEVVSIGCRDEYMPQVEALIELKAEINNSIEFWENPEGAKVYTKLVDSKINQVLEKVLLSK